MAELSAADRAVVLQRLEQSVRYLGLLSARLAEGGEPEAADLTAAAAADIAAVCKRLSPTTSGLPVDPLCASTLFTPLAEAAQYQCG